MTAITHILIIEPNGTALHWALPLRRAEAVSALLDEAGRRYPTWRHELHWQRVFGHPWALLFVAPSRTQPADSGAVADSPVRQYLAEPD